MPAKILIKRRFKEGAHLEILALLHDLRFAAMSQPGYVSGETLMQYQVKRWFPYGCAHFFWHGRGLCPRPLSRLRVKRAPATAGPDRC